MSSARSTLPLVNPPCRDEHLSQRIDRICSSVRCPLSVGFDFVLPALSCLCCPSAVRPLGQHVASATRDAVAMLQNRPAEVPMRSSWHEGSCPRMRGWVEGQTARRRRSAEHWPSRSPQSASVPLTDARVACIGYKLQFVSAPSQAHHPLTRSRCAVPPRRGQTPGATALASSCVL